MTVCDTLFAALHLIRKEMVGLRCNDFFSLRMISINNPMSVTSSIISSGHSHQTADIIVNCVKQFTLTSPGVSFFFLFFFIFFSIKQFFIFYKNLVYKNFKAWNNSKIKNIVVILLLAISISFKGFNKKWCFYKK